MARKKKVQEGQSAVSEIPTVEMVSKKRNKVKVKTEVIEISEDEPEQTISEDLDFSLAEDDSPLATNYTVEEILARLGSSDESMDDGEPSSDDIFDQFDRDLEAKGLGDDYFRKLDDELKEMKLEREIHDFEIDKMLNEED